ncbi:uncharacterized protein LOC132752867 [Ruditapes philippinarum]|uniref:uncharacterized protein LOC132752867 n=1 Tax=Ruditapes philippinarum TaxID=129788 RepID=UPI00295A9B25|nr:uncharacterized protein LOC132752867 [Ruditapes philippinarum]
MGTCLGTRKPKRNSVCPSFHDRSPRQKAPEDMMRDLEEANVEDSKFASSGVSFVVDFKDGDLTRMPSRLADRLNGTDKSTEDNNEVIYTSEEKEILAELLRNDILREKREKAAGLSGAKF